jgi:hypothetical protein
MRQTEDSSGITGNQSPQQDRSSSDAGYVDWFESADSMLTTGGITVIGDGWLAFGESAVVADDWALRLYDDAICRGSPTMIAVVRLWRCAYEWITRLAGSRRPRRAIETLGLPVSIEHGARNNCAAWLTCPLVHGFAGERHEAHIPCEKANLEGDGTRRERIAISEAVLRHAIWAGCRDANLPSRVSTPSDAVARLTSLDKRRQRRYSFPVREYRNRQQRVWQRLFPWNHFRSRI